MFAICLIAIIFSQLAGASPLVCPKALVPSDSMNGESWETRLVIGRDDPWLDDLELPVRRALFWKTLTEHPRLEAGSEEDSPEIYRLRRSKESQALIIPYFSLERLQVWGNVPSPGSLYSNLGRDEVFELLAILFEHSTSVFQNPLAPDFSAHGLATKLKPNIEVVVIEIPSQGKIRVLRNKGSGAIHCGVRHIPGTRAYQLLIPVSFAVAFLDHRYETATTDTLVLTVAQWPNHNATYFHGFSPLQKELWRRESAFFERVRSNKKSKQPSESGRLNDHCVARTHELMCEGLDVDYGSMSFWHPQKNTGLPMFPFDGDTPPEVKSTDPHRGLTQWHRRLTWMQTRVRWYRAETHARWGKSVSLSTPVLSQLSKHWQRYELSVSELGLETQKYQTFLHEIYFPAVENWLAAFTTEDPVSRSDRNKLIFQGLRALSYFVGHPGLAEYWDKNFQDMLPWEHRRVFSLFYRAERLLGEDSLTLFANHLKDPKVVSLSYDELCRWGDQFLRYHGEPEFHPLFFPKGS